MALGRRKMDTESFGSVDSRPLVMAYNTSGWTPAASTKRGIVSFQKLSIPCFAGIAKRLYAMCTWQMFGQKIKWIRL